MAGPQVVLDTNVWVSAFRSRRGTAWQLVQLLRSENAPFDLHVSVPLVFEYESVFRRQRREMDLSEAELTLLLDIICEIGVHHDIYYLWRGFLQDPDDAHVLELAVKARCDLIVTYNVRDFVGSEVFGVDVTTPYAFLQQLEGC